MWLELASHLHKSLQEVKQQTTSTEFLLWIEYLKREQTIHRKEDYYYAQIAAEVRKTKAKYPEKIKISHLLLKFGSKEKKKKMSIKERIKASKKFWMGLVGMKVE